MSVIPQDCEITIQNVAAFPDLFRVLIGAPPLKWWQRLYIQLRWGRDLKRARKQMGFARAYSKPRTWFIQKYGFDPWAEEDENAEKEN